MALKVPSPSCPFGSATKPPKIDRAAEALAWRAIALRWASSRVSPAAMLLAATKAAKPEALDAKPEAVGKLFSLITLARSSVPARARTRDKTFCVLSKGLPVASLPFKMNSSSRRPEENSQLVSVHIGDSVNDKLGTAGKFKARSSFPQYLESAMFERAMTVVFFMCLPKARQPCKHSIHATSTQR